MGWLTDPMAVPESLEAAGAAGPTIGMVVDAVSAGALEIQSEDVMF